ncbi:glutamine-hydrolyzing carbamoyl-phosphate synthase small subunit [Tropheryma whipplei]|uniref:glutamine-hydrolyzing carbamoyl-phosphate synthase small subunit n=2 Tax=Tropheryma whipplei TaxID=2039 RepID=UPI0005713F4F|nr:glutamine-hydrolyzing carbamoyl-phosphate synthase small subunit [Tropheryma whipplei]
MLSFRSAVFVMEDGSCFEGVPFGAVGTAFGEAVFSTCMTGYQEVFTDPSYTAQILVMTAVHVGNTGINDFDNESDRMWPSGVVIRDPSPIASSFLAKMDLAKALASEGVIGISEVDTRAIVRKLRTSGAMRAGIFSQPDRPLPDLVDQIRGTQSMHMRSLTSEVSTTSRRFISSESHFATLLVLDLGVKKSTINLLLEQGFDIWLMPHNISFDEAMQIKPDAIFYSNGPGDPAASGAQVDLLRSLLRAGLPYFGICFGNQLLARALGFETKKLLFGHRGINQPVFNRATKQVEITSQNHGFSVDMPIDRISVSPLNFGRVEVSHYCLNDYEVEGIRCLDIPAMSVQYHPESCAGPHDSRYLFREFRRMVEGHLERRYNAEP